VIELINKLLEVLRDETTRYRNLKSLAEQQRELLVAGRVEALPENVRLEEKDVFALSPLVAKRNEILGKLAKLHRLASMDLKELLKRAPIETVEDLKRAVMDLGRAARDLETVNKGNEKLLNNAMSYVNFSLKVITSGGKKQAFRPSASTEEKGPSLVDRVV